jgi:TetR/AcrR family transcriptional repressor of nem operon
MSQGTRDKLIATARKLMLTKGYGATGVDEICKASGASKGSFYHCFSTKEDIAIAALDDFYREGLAHLTSLPLPAGPPEERFLAFLDALAKDGGRVWHKGCLLGGLASEMSTTSPTVQVRLGELFDEMAGALPPMTAKEMAEHLLIVVEGAIVLARAHNDPGRIHHAIATYARFLRNLRKPARVAALKPKGKK